MPAKCRTYDRSKSSSRIAKFFLSSSRNRRRTIAPYALAVSRSLSFIGHSPRRLRKWVKPWSPTFSLEGERASAGSFAPWYKHQPDQPDLQRLLQRLGEIGSTWPDVFSSSSPFLPLHLLGGPRY